jgi:hypothetical protein
VLWILLSQKVWSGPGSDHLDQNLHIFLNGPNRLWLPTYFFSVADPDPDLFKEKKISSPRRVNV